MPQGPGQYRPIPFRPIAKGLDDRRNPILIEDGAAASLKNAELDAGSLRNVRGAVKMNNQTAPHCGVLCKPGHAPLAVEAGRSVPTRGHIVVPYDPRQDIGGDFGEEDLTGGSPPADKWYHTRRGTDFGINIGFELPADTKLFKHPRLGNLTNFEADSPPTNWDLTWGFDQALDECTILVQKGGDRLTPMSWALGIVNVADALAIDDGSGNSLITGGSKTKDRASSYLPVFMWLDTAGWGHVSAQTMRYELTDGQSIDNSEASDSGGEFCTMAYRAFIVDHPILPGRRYSIHLQLTQDTDTTNVGSGEEPTVGWNNDGKVEVMVVEDGTASTYEYDQDGDPNNPSVTGVHVWKGPEDSLNYLCKYGVRYSGRDEMFIGLGQRFAAWNAPGWVPFGHDCTPMEAGGFRMKDTSDFSTSTYTTLHDGSYDLNIAHDSGAHASDIIEVNTESMCISPGGAQSHPSWTSYSSGTSIFGYNPWGFNGTKWDGLGSDASTKKYNTHALRGYGLVLQQGDDGSGNQIGGGHFRIDEYSETSGTTFNFRFSLWGDGWDGTEPTFTAKSVMVQAFRWNQRDTVVQDFRIYREARDLTDVRVEWSIANTVRIGDETEPDLDDLLGYWPLDDADGGVCRDLVGGVHAYFAPFALPVSDGGIRGKKQLFLSGEGEALVLDFKEDPVLQGQLLNSMRGAEKGFAVEMTFRMTGECHAHDADQTIGATSEKYARYAPWIACWEVDQSEESGMASDPQPILAFGHRIRLDASIGSEPFLHPMGFSLEIPEGGDQDGYTPSKVPGTNIHASSSQADGIHAWWQDSTGPTNYSRWSKTADWVGNPITVQFGLEPVSGGETYRVYIAATPKEKLLAEDGDGESSEFAYFTTQTVTRADLARSRLVIGGRMVADGVGYTEQNARMVVDEVRVFGATAPGNLPDSNGSRVDPGKGKITGYGAHPPRELGFDDLLRPVGFGGSTVDVTQESFTVTASGSTRLFDGDPTKTVETVEGWFLYLPGDEFLRPVQESTPVPTPRFYHVETTASGGATCTLTDAYEGETRKGVEARAFSIIGYTAFSDDVFGKAVALGRESVYEPGTTEAKDAAITRDYYENVSLPYGNWGFRVYSPLGTQSAYDVQPEWTRGVKGTRGNPILGLGNINQKVYAASKGSVYEVDDRWRLDGPLEDNTDTTINRSLMFRARRDPESGVMLPLHYDRVEFDRNDISNIDMIYGSNSGDDWYYDFWVRVHEFGRYQTLFWFGDSDADQSLDADEANLQSWIRLSNGFPEYVLGSDAAYNVGGDTLDRNRYVARSPVQIPLGEWVHIRWLLTTSTSNSKDFIDTPNLYINGKKVTVTVNGNTYDVDRVDGQWVKHSTVPDLTAAATEVLLGCAMDAHFMERDNTPLTNSSVGPNELKGDMVQGYIHVLGGQMAGALVGSKTAAASNVVAGFDPYNNSDNDASIVSVLKSGLQDGIGHRIEEVKNRKWGRIMSHPFISLFHKFGNGERAAFAPSGNELFVANGGRPVIIEEGKGRFAGLLPPSTELRFETTRKPLWVENLLDSGGDADNDPGSQANTAASSWNGELKYHGSNFGNAYVSQLYHSELDWEEDDYIAFKTYIKMRSVEGRIPVYSRRSSLQSGGLFVEIRDGKVAVGWYDVVLKKEVYVETTSPVIEPGYWHYIYVRKRRPRLDAGDHDASGDLGSNTLNWVDDFYYDKVAMAPKSFTGDALIVRRFPRAAQSTTEYYDWTGFDATTAARNCISFTTKDAVPGTGGSATGRVSHVTTGFVGINGTPGQVDCSTACFHQDMVGMLFQWGVGDQRGQAYRIVAFNSTTSVDVIDEDGNSPDFWNLDSTYQSSAAGAVYAGVGLRKSEDFDASTKPDSGTYNVEMFGSALAANPLNGVTRFNGEFSGWALTVQSASALSASGHVYNGLSVGQCDLFEDATSLTSWSEAGTDQFSALPYTGSTAGQLQANATYTFSAVDTRVYSGSGSATSLPNEEKKLEMEAQASDNADDAYWRFLADQTLLEGTRRILVTFYDPVNDAESAPSPVLTVLPAKEDKTNPSSEQIIKLKELPVSPDGPGVWRRIYVSLLDGAELFLVKEVQDNTTAEVSFTGDDGKIASGIPWLADKGAPPRCSVIQESAERMFYGNAVGQEDGVYYSVAGRPSQVPPENLAVFDTGERDPVTGMGELFGKIVLFKRSGLRWLVIQNGLPLLRSITSDGVGAVSHQSIQSLDDRLYFVSDNGPYVFLGTGTPVFLGRRMQTYWRDTLDHDYLPQVSATINRLRNQYVFTVKDDDSFYTRERFSIQYDHAIAGAGVGPDSDFGHRISRYEGPNIVALGRVDSREGGPQDMIGGTEEGFVVWMDSTWTNTHMMGPHAANQGTLVEMHGPKTFTVNSATDTEKVLSTSSANLDPDLEGPRGAVIRILDSSSDEQEAVILGVDGGAIMLDRKIDWGAGLSSQTVSVGAIMFEWLSQHVDAKTPYLDKVLRYLDLTREAQSSGTMKADLYQNMGATAIVTKSVDLTEAFETLTVMELQCARCFQLKLRTETPTVDQAFDLLDLIFQVDESDLKGLS